MHQGPRRFVGVDGLYLYQLISHKDRQGQAKIPGQLLFSWFDLGSGHTLAGILATRLSPFVSQWSWQSTACHADGKEDGNLIR